MERRRLKPPADQDEAVAEVATINSNKQQAEVPEAQRQFHSLIYSIKNYKFYKVRKKLYKN